MKTTHLLLALLIIAALANAVFAQNPFTSKAKNKQPVAAPLYQSRLFEKIIVWQHQIKEKMSALVRESKERRSILPLLSVVLAAFGYGAIHAAGPGHGKAFALSYVLTRRPSFSRGLIFANAMAFFHGISGICFVLVVRLILHSNITKNLDSVTLLTQRISYGLITCLGVAIFTAGLYHLVKRQPGHVHKKHAEELRQDMHPVVSALVIGCIPCPGVVMVMLFALSMDLIGLGILLGIAISAGMAVTLSTVVMVAVFGKLAAVSVTAENENRMMMLENIMKILGGILLAGLGSVFLLSVL